MTAAASGWMAVAASPWRPRPEPLSHAPRPRQATHYCSNPVRVMELLLPATLTLFLIPRTLSNAHGMV